MILKFREMGLDLTDYPLLASSELYLSLIYSYWGKHSLSESFSRNVIYEDIAERGNNCEVGFRVWKIGLGLNRIKDNHHVILWQTLFIADIWKQQSF